jgi:integrase
MHIVNMPTVELVVPEGTALAVRLNPGLIARAAKNAERPRSAGTVRAYRTDWQRFQAWCRESCLPSMPAAEATIVVHLTQLDEEHYSYASICRAYAAIRAEHVSAGDPLPTLPGVRNALENIGRLRGTASEGMAALMNDKVREIARLLADDADDPELGPATRMLAARDAALMTVGFASGSRRSELVALDVCDLTFETDGVVLYIWRGKTDQLGKGRRVGVPFGSKGSCPVRAIHRWLDAGGIVDGAVFRGIDRAGRVRGRLAGQGVERAVKRAVAMIGLDPHDFGAHSLRAGLLTSAEAAGKSLAAGMRQTGHKSERVAMRYLRHASLFTANAASGLL